jgi:hypothetical protein
VTGISMRCAQQGMNNAERAAFLRDLAPLGLVARYVHNIDVYVLVPLWFEWADKLLNWASYRLYARLDDYARDARFKP